MKWRRLINGHPAEHCSVADVGGFIGLTSSGARDLHVETGSSAVSSLAPDVYEHDADVTTLRHRRGTDDDVIDDVIDDDEQFQAMIGQLGVADVIDE